MSRRRSICAGAILSLCVSAASGAQRPPGDLAGAIRVALESGDAGMRAFTPDERAQLARFYGAAGYAPQWVDASGRLNPDGRDALALIEEAAADGLDPADYHAPALAATATALADVPAALADVARFDRGLTAGVLRYLRHLHAGRVDPRTIGFHMTSPRDDDDFPALLHAAVAEHRLRETAAALAPPLSLYRAMRAMLARYRTLAADPTLTLPPAPPRPVKPGQPYDSAAALQRLLVALGDMQAGIAAAPVPSVYDGRLVDGVRRFQARHGLDADGVLGQSTQAALHVPLAWRARQIELGLERLRWLPHLRGERLVAVNIPMFRLWAWNTIPPGGTPPLGMGVIVGRALNTQTPVFAERMDYLIFRPYWNVPRSIVRGEMLPAIARDPDYLRRQDMEIVSGPGDDARPVDASAAALSELRDGRLRLRQRPGPTNALGLVKFVFPNDANVYLHGTPATRLFRPARRDFSHGCVRVEDPVALAAWALEGQDGWTRDRILEAMNGTRPLRVDLRRPIQVILFYITAVVLPEDGTIRFADDIYGHDARLNRALGR